MTTPITETALRRAARYLKLDRHDTGCNEVETLRALVEQAQQASASNRSTLALEVAQQVREEGADGQLLAEWMQHSQTLGSRIFNAMADKLDARVVKQESVQPGLYAIRHLDNWDGEGDICVSLATYSEKGDGIWRHHENGAPVLEYQGDKILQAWHLHDNTAPALTYDAGLDAAAAHVLERIEQYRLEHGTHGDSGLELATADRNHVYELQRLWESIRQLASADPVPCSHAINQPAESVNP